MRLPHPFIRLPVRFDAERLQAEVAALPTAAWHEHPNHLAGNSCARLISVDGGENDHVQGRMRATAHLERMPYVRQILASFGVVWSRSRLMRLAPHANVPEHADINHHWFYRVRLHIPIATQPPVRFHCGDTSVHMAPGEAWVFDNWRLHRVENPTPQERIHLVADTTGSATFWQFVASSLQSGIADTRVAFDAARASSPAAPPLLVEQALPARIMPPAEVDLLLKDLCAELQPLPELADGAQCCDRYIGLLEAFRHDWRQLHALHGDATTNLRDFATMRDALRSSARAIEHGLVMHTNRVAAGVVLEGRVTRALVNDHTPQRSDAHAPSPASARATASARAPAPARAPRPGQFRAPLIILAAPRSGSTLLLETLVDPATRAARSSV